MKEKNNVCPKCGGSVVLVEYSLIDPFHYDGTSEYACVKSMDHLAEADRTCDYRLGRFCGKPLGKHEVEPPYCKGKAHPSVG